MGISQKGNKLRLTGKDAVKSGKGYATSVNAPTTIGVEASNVEFKKTIKDVLDNSVEDSIKSELIKAISSAREEVVSASSVAREYGIRALAFNDVEESLKAEKRAIRAAIAARPESITVEEQLRIDNINHQLELNADFKKADSDGYYEAKWAVANAYTNLTEAEKALEAYTGVPLINDYPTNKIGHAVSIGEQEAGTEEWHSMRALNSDNQFVMTGSRAWVADGGYSPYSNEAKLAQEMLDSIDPTIEPRRVKSSAMALGDTMEEPILREHAKRHPNETHWLTKATYESTEDKRFRANIDGLSSSTGGDTPDTIVEIKTASSPSDWEDEKGNAVVPPWYNSQLKHYCASTGLRKARIIVKIGQYDDREVEVSFTDNEIAEYKAKAIEFLDNVESRRVNL